MSVGIITGIIGSVVGLAVLGYCFKNAVKFKNNWYHRKMTNQNIIAIIHSANASILSLGGDTMIGLNTHIEFIKNYNKMDKDKDIHIILHTTGGALSSAESICNCIANHAGKGKIIAYIPYYSYSGGCMIALACDKIVMAKNAILGPCDAQKASLTTQYSVASVIDTVNYKKENKEKIKEEWLAHSYDANLCKDRQKKYVEKLMKCGHFTENIGNKIYEEFFSGKYNHDKIFSAADAIELGINVDTVDIMPELIKNIVYDI